MTTTSNETKTTKPMDSTENVNEKVRKKFEFDLRMGVYKESAFYRNMHYSFIFSYDEELERMTKFVRFLQDNGYGYSGDSQFIGGSNVIVINTILRKFWFEHIDPKLVEHPSDEHFYLIPKYFDELEYRIF